MPRIELTLPDELLARVDQARGLIPRATYIRDVLERTHPAQQAETPFDHPPQQLPPPPAPSFADRGPRQPRRGPDPRP